MIPSSADAPPSNSRGVRLADSLPDTLHPMPDVMLTRREAVIWAAAFVVLSVLLVVTRFASDDPDSALYAQLATRLAATARVAMDRAGVVGAVEQ